MAQRDLNALAFHGDLEAYARLANGEAVDLRRSWHPARSAFAIGLVRQRGVQLDTVWQRTRMTALPSE
jgi:hypothetical protein